MSNRLSHSAVSKYQQCPRAFRYHYLEKLREETTSGALLFGSAFDSAINALLTDSSLDPFSVFDNAFSSAEINKQPVFVPESPLVVYAKSDYDEELLHQEDLNKIGDTSRVGQILNLKESFGWENLPEDDKIFYNRANWLSMRRKGHLMIQAYKDKIVPKIKSVKAVQRKIEIDNGQGDIIIGYVDIVLEWHDGSVVIFDNKTSSIEYKPDSVLSSPQLALYVFALKEEFNTRKAGYIVLRKQIIKNRKKVCPKCFYQAEKGARHKTCNQEYNGSRCNTEWHETIDPEVDFQIIIDEIPEQTEAIVMENFDDVNNQIKAGIFTRNFNSCVMPYGKCAFYNKCWRNDDKGLIKVD